MGWNRVGGVKFLLVVRREGGRRDRWIDLHFNRRGVLLRNANV